MIAFVFACVYMRQSLFPRKKRERRLGDNYFFSCDLCLHTRCFLTRTHMQIHTLTYTHIATLCTVCGLSNSILATCVCAHPSRIAVWKRLWRMQSRAGLKRNAAEYGESVCVAVCCSVLQCVAVCYSVLPCVAECCRVLWCVCGGLNFGMAWRGVLQNTARERACCSVLRRVAVSCSVLQCVADCCSLFVVD